MIDTSIDIRGVSVFLYIYVCMYTCMYVCMCVLDFQHSHTHMHTQKLYGCVYLVCYVWCFGYVCMITYNNKKTGYGTDDFKPVKKYQGSLAHRK